MILKMINPYEHFYNNPNCLLFGENTLSRELTDKELEAFNDEEAF